MKTSRIVLWSGAAFLGLLILASLISLKISLGRDLGPAVRQSERQVSGISSVVYGGEVSENRLRTEGQALVERR